MLGLRAPHADPVLGANPEVTHMLAYIRKVAQVRRDEGASAVEYGLLVAAIAALIVLVVFALGGVIQGVFKDTCDKVSSKGGADNASASCNTE